MISSEMLTIISRRLNEISGIDYPFGGFNIIEVGDLFQLRPVQGRPIYTNHILWRLFVPVLLEQNVRQCNDQSFARLLNRARIGDLLPQDIDILKTRLIDINTDDHQSALHIYPIRKDVTRYNTIRQQLLSHNQITINAVHYLSERDRTPGADVPIHLIPTDDHDAGNLITK